MTVRYSGCPPGGRLDRIDLKRKAETVIAVTVSAEIGLDFISKIVQWGAVIRHGAGACTAPDIPPKKKPSHGGEGGGLLSKAGGQFYTGVGSSRDSKAAAREM